MFTKGPRSYYVLSKLILVVLRCETIAALSIIMWLIAGIISSRENGNECIRIPGLTKITRVVLELLFPISEFSPRHSQITVLTVSTVVYIVTITSYISVTYVISRVSIVITIVIVL